MAVRRLGTANRHKAVVLGAGGAARAVIYGLLERGVERIVVSIGRRDRAEALQERFGARVHAARWEERDAALGDADSWSTPRRSAWPGSPALDHRCRRACPTVPIVADLFTCRWSRR